jgi:outer membrane protein OmpA-like peptidoglycan-associated protein
VAFSDAAHVGQTVRLDIEVPSGTHDCRGTLNAQFTDGTEGSMPLAFTVNRQNPIELRATTADLDIENRRLRVHLNQPVAQLVLQVFGDKGTVIAQTVQNGVSKKTATLEWQHPPTPVTRLRITASGKSGLATNLDLFPWRFDVPHDDVIFPSGSSLIPPAEEFKLLAAKQEIDATLNRFAGGSLGFDIPIQLFVAGYTDTVGNAIANRTLSEQRARSIATWFRLNGFTQPIHYQGFGESALAVPTPDETDAPANRRAEYIIASDLPQISASMPSNRWVLLR